MYTCQISQKCVFDLAAQVSCKKKLRILRATTCTLIHKVLSESVSKALTSFGGTETKETALFTEMFDKFFDALNVQNFNDEKTQ